MRRRMILIAYSQGKRRLMRNSNAAVDMPSIIRSMLFCTDLDLSTRSFRRWSANFLEGNERVQDLRDCCLKSQIYFCSTSRRITWTSKDADGWKIFLQMNSQDPSSLSAMIVGCSIVWSRALSKFMMQASENILATMRTSPSCDANVR